MAKNETQITTVDARGLACPEPALLTRAALLGQSGGCVEVLVDACTARDNAARTGERMGWKVVIEAEPAGAYRLVMTK